MAAHELSRTKLSYGELWCWEATLEAFGVFGTRARERDGSMMLGDIKHHLQVAGYAVTRVELPLWGNVDENHSRWETRKPSLSRFIAEHLEGDWLVGTSGHIMALRSGQLTDTDLPATGRRLVAYAYRVEESPKRLTR